MERHLIPGSIFFRDEILPALTDKSRLRVEARRHEEEFRLVKVHVTVAMLLLVKCEEQKHELTCKSSKIYHAFSLMTTGLKGALSRYLATL